MAQKAGDTYRLINAFSAVALLAFLLVHIAFAVAWLWSGHLVGLAQLAWIGVGLCVLHIALCVVTSMRMLGDTVRPPSKRKRQHLWLKWASGVAVVAALVLHVLMPGTIGYKRLFLVLFIGLLAWHAFVGVKSLLKDLNIPSKYRNAVRIVLIGVAVCFALAAAFA